MAKAVESSRCIGVVVRRTDLHRQESLQIDDRPSNLHPDCCVVQPVGSETLGARSCATKTSLGRQLAGRESSRIVLLFGMGYPLAVGNAGY